jgi:hypothetical protein
MANAIIAIRAAAESGNLAAARRGILALATARRAAEIRAQLARDLVAQALE